jgi:probable rRNA maturation factor
MILLDPDLDPDPAPARQGRTPPPKTPPVRLRRARSQAGPGFQSIPSTRTLGRFLMRAQGLVRLRGRVSVLLTTDSAVRRLNRRFRGIDKPTDVLSFPSEALPRGGEKIAGDLAISVPTARRQAIEQGHGVSAEIKVLMLHGLLHLAGYDHESDQGQMARREQRLRTELGLPRGLIERVRRPSSLNRGEPGAARSSAARPRP